MSMERIRLKTHAKDNFNREYSCSLQRDWKYGGILVLVFDGAPSGWAVKTLLRTHSCDRLSIDFGQYWDCINIQDILNEIRNLTTIERK